MLKLPIRILIQRLHIFTDDNGTYMVAYDPEDAKKAWLKNIGAEWDESFEPFNQVLKDSEIFRIYSYPEDFDDAKKTRPPFSKIHNDKDLPYITAPAWLWCLWHGRCFLCSTEF